MPVIKLNKKTLTISALVLVVIFLAFYLTRKNQRSENVDNSIVGNVSEKVSQTAATSIVLLKDSFKVEVNPEKKANFATRLSANYEEVGKLDSAAVFSGIAAEDVPNEENLFEAGKQFFNAFSVEPDAQTASGYAEKSEYYLSTLLEKEPGHTEGRVLLGVLFLTTNRTSNGVELLREVVKDNPNHQEANFNLGVNALQAGAFEPAAKYFELIVKQDSSNVQSTFYLALCYQQMGRKSEAVRLLNKVKELDNSPEVQANVDAYLNDIE